MMTIGAPKKPDDIDQATWDAAGKVANAYRSNQEIIARALMAHRAPLEAALRTIQNTCARYIHPEGTMTAEEFIDEVLGAADNRDLVKAMGTSGGGSAMVNKALEGKK